VCLCYSQAAGELIRLSARLSLHFGLPVNVRVGSSCVSALRTHLDHSAAAVAENQRA
jgi:hypothetical protein